MIIKFLSTTGVRMQLEDVEKGDTIESLKIKLYRHYSDSLPIPQNFVVEQDQMELDDEKEDVTQQELNSRYALLPSKILHPYQIRLLYLGKQLNDFDTISDSQIQLSNEPDKPPPVLLIAISPFKLFNNGDSDNNNNNKIKKEKEDIDKIQKDIVFIQKPKEPDESISSIITAAGDEAKGESLFTLSISDKLYGAPEKFQHLLPLGQDDALQLFSRVDSDSLEKGTGVLKTGVKEATLKRVDKVFNVKKESKNSENSVSELSSVLDKLSLVEKNVIQVVKPPLLIDSATPKGDTSFASSVVVTFNKPVLPLNCDASKYPVPFLVSPVVPEASWVWTNGTTCTYSTPTRKPFPSATTYTITPLLSVFTETYKEPLEESSPWTFTTSPPYVSYANYRDNNVFISFSHPVSISESDKRLFSLTSKKPSLNLFGGDSDSDYSDDEDSNTLWSRPSSTSSSSSSSSSSSPINFHFITQLSDEDKKKPCYSYSQPSDTLIILAIDSEVKGGHTIQLAVKKGIKSKQGPNTMEQEASFSFKKPEIKPLDIKPEKLSFSSSPKSFVFISNNPVSNPFTKEKVDYENYVSISPRVEIKNVQVIGSRIEVVAQYVLDSSYTCKISNFKDIYEQTMKEPVVSSIKFPPKKPTIKFSDNRRNYNLDPLSKPIIKVESTGIDEFQITAYRIKKQDYAIQIKKPLLDINSLTFLSSKMYNFKQEGDYDVPTITEVDLSPFFGASNSIEATESLLFFRISNKKNIINVDEVLQYTPYLITVFVTDLELVVFLTDAHTKSPISSNATIEITKDKQKKLYLDPYAIVDKHKTEIIIGHIQQNSTSKTKDVVLFIENMTSAVDYVKLDLHTVSDAPIYRPGDTVNLSSVAKIVSDDGVFTPKVGFTSLGYKYIRDMSYTVFDSKNKVLLKGTKQMDDEGRFTTSFELPLQMFLGNTFVEFVYKGPDALDFKFNYDFRVEEFKRKQLLVQTNKLIYQAVKGKENNNYTNDKQAYVYEGEPFAIQVEAKAYSEETLPNTIVDWSIYVSETSPFCAISSYDSNYSNSHISHGPFKYTSGKNLTGKHHLDLILTNTNGKCLIVKASGIIRDGNQNEQFKEDFIVIPKTTYICVSKEKNILSIDEPLKYSWFLQDLFGNFSTAGNSFIKIKRIPWEEELPMETVYNSQVVPSEEGPTEFNFNFKKTGRYIVEFEHTNDDQTPQFIQKEVTILGELTDAEKEYISTTPSTQVTTAPPTFNYSFMGDSYSNLFSVKPHCDLKVDFDKTFYKVGDSCTVAVKSKITNGHGYVLISKSAHARQIYPFNISNGVGSLKIQMADKFYPKVHAHVYVEGSMDLEINENKVSRITSDSVSKYLLFDLEEKKLNVSVKEFKKFQAPNEKSSVVVSVNDYTNKKPIKNASVTLAVVDKSLLDCATTPDQDPFEIFYPQYFSRPQAKTSLLGRTIYFDPPKITKPKEEEVTATTNEIKIRYFSGRILIFKVSNQILLGKLQSMVQERDGLPPTSQRLFYLNKQLPDTAGESTLEALGVPNGATINLVIRLSGGANNSDDKPDPDTGVVAPPIRVRDNFKGVATFKVINTDENGQAKFEFTLPDNLTKYRIIAYANYDDCFGKASEFFTTSLPIMVRVNPSRFLRYNDRAQFPISVQNLVSSDLNLSIAFRSGHCDLDGYGYQALLPAYGRVVVPASINARVSNVTTNLQVIVKTTLKDDPSQEFSDALNVSIPIPPLPIVESSCTSHSIDANVDSVVPLDVSISNINEIDQNTGGLTINLSNSPMQKMVNSVKYLLEYQHCCSEQISSKLMALIVLSNNPALFENSCIPIEYSDSDKVKKVIDEMIAVLKSRKATNKGFRYWDGSDSGVYEFVSIYVYWVLHILNNEYKVESAADLLSGNSAITYLSTLTKPSTFSEKEYKKNPESYLSTRAFACMVHLLIDPTASDPTEMSKTIMKRVDKDITHASGIVNILSFLSIANKNSNSDNIKLFTKQLETTARVAYFKFGSYCYGFNSQLRTTALFALLLIKTKKANDSLLVKLINGIVHHTLDNHYTTLDYSFSLYTLSHYIKKIGGTPDLSTTLYLNGGSHIVDQKIELDAMNKCYSTFIPIRQVLLNQGNGPLYIEKKGKGILFYDCTLQYAPRNIGSYKVVNDRGLSIKRSFVPIQNSTDVKYNSEQNIVEIVAGVPIKVVLEIQVYQTLDFVVIQDHLPAGLEPTVKPTKNYWMSHINLRERGIEVFANSLYTGHYSFNYICNSSTIGNFFTPACVISEMYNPTTFGRSESLYVQIK